MCSGEQHSVSKCSLGLNQASRSVSIPWRTVGADRHQGRMIAGVISDRSSAASLNAPWGSLNALVGPRPPFHVKDGHHRFSIAEALGLTSIPAVVVVVEGGVCSNGDKQPITD